MKKKVIPTKTILVNFVLDETGSMQSCLEPTISGFNEYVQGLQKDKKKKYLFTLTQWDARRFKVVYNSEPIKNVKPLTKETYVPGDMTPLYDAIAKTIIAVDAKINNENKKYAVLCVIMTDGHENASREYTLEAVRALIQAKEKMGWTFVYLGANQDAWAVGQTLGLHIGNTMSYDTKKTKGAFRGLAVNTALYASSGRGCGQSTMDFFEDKSAYEKSEEDNITKK